MAHILVDSILEKKGAEIILLDLREQTVLADYFLICSGENPRQLRAIADEVYFDAKNKSHILPANTEGNPESGWLLMDFGDVIIHIFLPKQRAFYDLEGLWSGGHVVLSLQ